MPFEHRHASSSFASTNANLRSKIEELQEMNEEKTVLIKKKEEEYRREFEAKNNRQRENVKKLSKEEKEKRILEMEQDAIVNDIRKINRHSNTMSEKIKSNEEVKNTGNAQFLDNMRSEVFQQSVKEGIEERLTKNTHYIQKKSEGDSENFMKK